jgi:hypothetical protein
LTLQFLFEYLWCHLCISHYLLRYLSHSSIRLMFKCTLSVANYNVNDVIVIFLSNYDITNTFLLVMTSYCLPLPFWEIASNLSRWIFSKLLKKHVWYKFKRNSYYGSALIAQPNVKQIMSVNDVTVSKERGVKEFVTIDFLLRYRKCWHIF